MFYRSFTAFPFPNYVAIVLSPIALILSGFYLKNLSFPIVSVELWEGAKGSSHISRYIIPSEVRTPFSPKKITLPLIFKKLNHIPIIEIEHFGVREAKSSFKMTELGYSSGSVHLCWRKKQSCNTMQLSHSWHKLFYPACFLLCSWPLPMSQPSSEIQH